MAGSNKAVKRSRAEIDAGGRRLAAAVKDKRTSLGMTQPQAADHFKVKKATLQAIEQRLGREFREETLRPFNKMVADTGKSAYELFCPPPEPMATRAEVEELRTEIRRQGDQLDALVALVAERIPQVPAASGLAEVRELVERLIAERGVPGVWQ